MKLTNKLLLIGWNAADWKVINPLLDAGEMPALEQLVDRGVIANISTLDPPYSPMLWTSIATGKHPDKHGILGFTEPIPGMNGIRPVSSTSRKVKAVWNILMQEGYKVHTVGWWPGHPAEPLNGCCISDLYKDCNAPLGQEWKMLPGAVHPLGMEELFSELRIHPGEITEELLKTFVPDHDEADESTNYMLLLLAKYLAECSSLHAAATWIMENQEWNFLAVCNVAIDHFCRGFMNFHPPKLKHIPDKLFRQYRNVVDGIYRYHDMMLERLLELAGDDTTVMIVSDHGFHPDRLRPLLLHEEPAVPAFQRSDLGIFCAAGPNIKKDERIYGASLLNITPTILTMFGLPVGEDMDAPPLVHIFNEEINVEKVPSWDKIPGKCGMHPPQMIGNHYDAQEAVRQLIELGYIEAPGADMKKAVNRTIREAKFNLARVYIGSGRHIQAIPLLEELFAEMQAESRFAVNLATCYRASGDVDKSMEVIRKFRDVHATLEANLKELNELRKMLQDAGIADDRKKKIFARHKELYNDTLSLREIDMLEADLLFKKGELRIALNKYSELEKIIPTHQPLFIKKGNAFLKLRKADLAIREFKKALALDPENHHAHHGIGIAMLNEKRYEEAVESLLTSLGINYRNPSAHYHLGNALDKIGRYEEAAKACEVCLSMSPKYGKARNLTIMIYEERLNMPGQAEAHRKTFRLNPPSDSIRRQGSDNNTIYVVSGLPRSGTSMMMQMLNGGGLEVFTDNKREADENNPKGYFEHEAVTRLARDKTWVKHARGKVVKVISRLLIFLPATYNYKVIFMVRDIDEVIASQQKMLEKKGKQGSGTYNVSLKENYEKNLEKLEKFIKENHNMEVIFIHYADVIGDPFKQALKINIFLDNIMNTDRMVEAVSRELYRTKLKNSNPGCTYINSALKNPG